MNVIVTGAVSFLGLSVVRKLMKENIKVFCMLRKNSPNNEKLPISENIKVIYSLDELPNDISYFALFHFAWGGVGSAGRDDDNIQKENIEFSKKIYLWCKKNKVEKFIFAGSQAEYGGKSKYGIAKNEFANFAKCNLDDTTKFIHLRIFSIYGEDDHKNSLIDYCCDNLLKGTTADLGNCTHKWNYLYVEDFANILFKILTLVNKNATYDIASHTSKLLKEYIDEIGVNANFGVREDNVEGAKDLTPNIEELVKDINDFSEIDFKAGINKILLFKQNRSRCIVCNEELDKTIFVLNDAPDRAQKLLKENSINNKIRLNLCTCSKCALFELNNKEVPYYKEVIRSGGISSTMKNLRIEEYNRLFSYVDTNKTDYRICECGSGKNEFLNVWKDTKMYQEFHLELLSHNYDKELNFTFDIFTSFNFLEHQVDPKKMLDEIYEHLSTGGYGLITVPSFEFIYENGSYYELIIDHIAYYSMSSLEYLLSEVGFTILHKQFVNTNKDTLEFIVKKDSKKANEIFNKIDSLMKKDTSNELIKIDNNKLSKKFYDSYIETNRNVNEFIKQIGSKSLSCWGASHQGFTLINTTELNIHTKYVIDSAPFKENCFVPGTNIKIVNPSYIEANKTDIILILAPGYVKEISDIIKNKCGDNALIYYFKGTNILRIGDK